MGRPAAAVKPQETLLGVCILRSGAAIARRDVESGRRQATDRASRWDVLRAAGKATAAGSRVAAFIVLWADALRDSGADSLGIEEFVSAGYASRATVYRRQAEFRELWPEYETPDALARMVLDALPTPDASLSPHVPITV